MQGPSLSRGERELEEAYLVRDLVNSDEGRKLYDLMKTLARVRMAMIYDDLRKGHTMVDAAKTPLGLAEYSAFSGELRGLEWVFYHVDGLVRKADREDERKAREPKEE